MAGNLLKFTVHIDYNIVHNIGKCGGNPIIINKAIRAKVVSLSIERLSHWKNAKAFAFAAPNFQLLLNNSTALTL